jgi:NlpE N-terminal domain
MVRNLVHMNASLLTATIAVLALVGCAHFNKVQTTFDPPYPEHNANGDSIRAVYEGRIPCGAHDCEQVKIALVLYQNQQTRAPTTYWLGTISVGKGNDRAAQQGTWSISRGVRDYPEALVYVLDANSDPALRYYWRVNKDIVLVLDQTMRPKVGNGAWGYMLSRYSAPYGPRTYRYDQQAGKFVGSGSTKGYGDDSENRVQ